MTKGPAYAWFARIEIFKSDIGSPFARPPPLENCNFGVQKTPLIDKWLFPKDSRKWFLELDTRRHAKTLILSILLWISSLVGLILASIFELDTLAYIMGIFIVFAIGGLVFWYLFRAGKEGDTFWSKFFFASTSSFSSFSCQPWYSISLVIKSDSELTGLYSNRQPLVSKISKTDIYHDRSVKTRREIQTAMKNKIPYEVGKMTYV